MPVSNKPRVRKALQEIGNQLEKDVADRKSIRKIAQDHGVPYSTVQLKAKKGPQIITNRRLFEEEEQKLVAHMRYMSIRGWSYTIPMTRALVLEMIRKRLPLFDANELGRNWYFSRALRRPITDRYRIGFLDS